MAIIPDNNINLATNIRDVLNGAGGVVDNNIVTFFSANAKLNRYSKYKPVRSSCLFNMTDALFKEVNYGYRIPDPVNLNTYIGGINGTSTPSQWAKPDVASEELKHGWYYQRPTGGIDQPYRIGDFRKYNTSAPQSLFGEVQAPSNIDQNTKSMYVSLDTGTFAISDFSHFNNMHIGVLIKGDGVQKYKSILSSQSTSQQYRIDFNEAEMKSIFSDKYGKYSIYVFATATTGQNISSSMDYYQTNLTDVYPLPVNTVVMNYIYVGDSSYFTFTLTEMEATRNTVYFKVSATNRTSTSRNVTANALTASVTAYNDDGSWSDSSPRRLSNQTVSVAANSTAVVGYFELTYSAYRELQEPWFVQVELYYPNSEGTDVYAGSGTIEYLGE